jgi:nitrogen fixation protein FixH
MTEILSDADKRANKWTPWYFVMFFVFIAIINGIFVVMATSTHRGLITENAYQKGLDYNDDILAVEKQTKLGWNGTFGFEKNTLTFALNDKQGTAIEQADAVAYLSRVAQDGDDFSVKLVHNKQGQYKQKISFPAKGQWNVTVAVKWNQKNYQQSTRITAK